jgi:hypothetical protein
LVRVICIYIPLFLSLSTKFNSVWVSGREGTEGSDEIPGKGNVEPKKKKKCEKKERKKKKSEKGKEKKRGGRAVTDMAASGNQSAVSCGRGTKE